MNIGGAMTAPLIVILTAHFGWQGALLWIALPAVLLTASLGLVRARHAGGASAR